MLKSEGSNHIVGDSSGWELYTNYTNRTQGREFHVGDVLVLNYNRDQHNVMQVNSTAYVYCGRDNYISLFNKGNDSIVISEVGEHWFICAVDGHCENGPYLYWACIRIGPQVTNIEIQTYKVQTEISENGLLKSSLLSVA
ncbi:hypothetical protein BRARA_A02982 [Brassica rapa]|uniref:Phytocyanin domain-containing protein n=1 Tax=Brassica campestris TaxID=3711 RepID=A0A398ARW2_BRACM|nr:hypothetical protein BRARA_A02982 [Brassica rapa]